MFGIGNLNLLLYQIATVITPEPPESNFMITEDHNYMIVEGTGNRMVTES